MKRRQLLKLMGASALGTFHLTGYDIDGMAQSVSHLNDMLEPIRSQHNVPALTAAFVRGNTLEGLGAVGRRAKNVATPVTTEDLWHLGSCTKSMTATLFGALVEKGVLAWTTTVGEVFANQFEFLDEFASLTPIQLLSHRTGFPGVAHADVYDPFQIRLINEARISRASVHQQRLNFAREVLNHPPVTTPGNAHDYSNFGYIVAGAMLEIITGDTWENLIQSELFEPLGMTSAGFGPPGTSAMPPDQPWSHSGAACNPVTPGPFADNPPIYGPTGRVHATMTDWAKYASLHINGINFLPTPILEWDTFNTLQADQFRQGYSLGWGVTQRPWAGGNALVHTGSNTMWMAVIWLAPNRNAGLMAATNCASDQAFPAIDAAIVGLINEFM